MRWLARGEIHLPEDHHWLAPREVRKVASLRYNKRRTDYLLTRWTAKEGVARLLGLAPGEGTLARIEVGNDSSGAPEVRLDGRSPGLGISLTDRAGWAVCLLSTELTRIGCDLELVEPRSAAFIRDYFTAEEQRLVAAAGEEADRWLAANLLWSAKESALKVLRTGLRRDTRSVNVLVSGDRSGVGWAALTARTEEGQILPGWWCRFGPFLLTVAADRHTAPPAALEDPPALAAAEPSHTWLARPT